MGVHTAAERPTITPQQLIKRAADAGLQGIELPVGLLQAQDLAAVAREIQERGFYLSLAAGGYDPAVLGEALRMAQRVGAGVVRTVVGGAKIGGDRRLMVGRWQSFLEEVLAKLKEAVTVAEQCGVNLAVENHQDLASEELLWLCNKIASPRFGITLDTGNPLATAEEPIDFVRRVAPHLKNVHLKDYRLYLSEEGYRLARCPLGQGVIDFPEILRICEEVTPGLPMSVELGALEARHIRVLMDDYWEEYPPRSAVQFARVIRFALKSATMEGDWRTPYEREAPVAEIVAYEEQELQESLSYCSSVLKGQ